MIQIRIGQIGDGAAGAGMDIAALTRSLITDAEMRQEQLAEELGVSQSTVSRIVSGATDPAYSLALKIIQLAATRGFLTNKHGTIRVTSSLTVRGHMTATDVVTLNTDAHQVEQADIPFTVPVGCFAVVVDADGLTSRARKGDLILAGPSVSDPNQMLDIEGVFCVKGGGCYFGILLESRQQGKFSILCQHNKRISNVEIEEVGPFFAVIAAGRWQSMA